MLKYALVRIIYFTFIKWFKARMTSVCPLKVYIWLSKPYFTLALYKIRNAKIIQPNRHHYWFILSIQCFDFQRFSCVSHLIKMYILLYRQIFRSNVADRSRTFSKDFLSDSLICEGHVKKTQSSTNKSKYAE